MKVHVHLDLYKLANIGASFNEVNFTDITEKNGFYEDYQEVKRLRIRYVSGNPQIDYYNDDLLPIPTGNLIGNDVMLLSDIRPTSLLSSIEFFAEYDNATNLKALITAGIVTLGITGYTVIELYRLNDKRNVLSKSKIFIGYIDGQFKNPISIKNFSIDVVDYPLTSIYNYVYIPKLGRYYYVNDVAFVSKDLTRISLVEDVLSSWEGLIIRQSALITRYGGGNSMLIDERLPVEDHFTISYLTLTHGTLKNVTFSADQTNKYNIMVTSISSIGTLNRDDINPPTGSDLPKLTTHYTDYDCLRFLDVSGLGKLILACYQDDVTASFVNGVLWLPFDPTTPFNASLGSAVYANDKVLSSGGTWESATYSGTLTQCYKTSVGGCPYLVIGDFEMPSATNFIGLHPYTYYEIWIPFVGWVEVNPLDVSGKRLLVYYTFDFKTGVSTAFIYNYTDKKSIYSSNCQIGVKLDLTTTNQLENTRQKQANDLNMLLSVIGSGISIGVGAYTGNGVAVAGGVLSGAKAIASFVNTNNQIFERATTTFGSSDGALHNPLEVIVRVKRRNAITTQSESTYLKLQGKPYNKYNTISSLTTGNYIEVGDIQFDTIDSDIYNVEIDEIVALLKSGVII